MNIDKKSKDVVFYGNEVANANRDIESVEKIFSLSLISINGKNGSGITEEISVWHDLREPLKNFLIEFYNNQKEKHYNSILETLK